MKKCSLNNETGLFLHWNRNFQFTDRTNPMEKHVEIMADLAGLDSAPITAQLFGNAGQEHMERFGTKAEHMAKIAYKNHKHSTNNP